jgi:DHA3 family macrolide efflux protein-like MFS transporter
MVSGALMTFAPLEILFLVDVVTAVIGISILFFLVKIPVTEKQISGQKRIDYFNDLKEGLRYIKNHGYILRLVILEAIYMICVSPASLLTPLQVTRDFGAEVWRLTAIEVAFSFGMMVGGMLIGVWGGFKNRIFTMSFAVAVSGLGVIGLGIVSDFIVYVGIMALIGISIPAFNTPMMVLFQSTVEPAFMGRVFSVFGMASSVMMPLGMLIFGPVADVVAIDVLLIGTGTVIVLLCIPYLASKTLREAGSSLHY